jgi:hypothetical protein
MLLYPRFAELQACSQGLASRITKLTLVPTVVPADSRYPPSKHSLSAPVPTYFQERKWSPRRSKKGNSLRRFTVEFCGRCFQT